MNTGLRGAKRRASRGVFHGLCNPSDVIESDRAPRGDCCRAGGVPLAGFFTDTVTRVTSMNRTEVRGGTGEEPEACGKKEKRLAFDREKSELRRPSRSFGTQQNVQERRDCERAPA